MPPPGLRIHLRPRVALIFDLLTPKVDRFMPLIAREILLCAANCHKIRSFVSEYVVFTSLVTDERTNAQTSSTLCLCQSGLVEA